ncbi:MAG: hypothetical protein VXA26_08405, partial [Candidatus Neomarinimicrobiota bacterium]
THNRFYWLRDENPTERSLIVASIEGQTISIDTTSINNFTIMLNDSILNMDKPVVVKYNEKEIFKGIVPRSSEIIKKSIKEYMDPKSVYYGEIPIVIKQLVHSESG